MPWLAEGKPPSSDVWPSVSWQFNLQLNLVSSATRLIGLFNCLIASHEVLSLWDLGTLEFDLGFPIRERCLEAGQSTGLYITIDNADNHFYAVIEAISLKSWSSGQPYDKRRLYGQAAKEKLAER